MSDEFDSHSEPKFSSFIPLTIAFSGFLIWFVFQVYELNNQRSGLQKNIDNAMPAISEAQNYNQRYLTLIRDLDATAKNDEAAKAILTDMFQKGFITQAIQAGLIHVQQGTNAAPAAPSDSTGTK